MNKKNLVQIVMLLSLTALAVALFAFGLQTRDGLTNLNTVSVAGSCISQDRCFSGDGGYCGNSYDAIYTNNCNCTCKLKTSDPDSSGTTNVGNTNTGDNCPTLNYCQTVYCTNPAYEGQLSGCGCKCVPRTSDSGSTNTSSGSTTTANNTAQAGECLTEKKYKCSTGLTIDDTNGCPVSGKRCVAQVTCAKEGQQIGSTKPYCCEGFKTGEDGKTCTKSTAVTPGDNNSDAPVTCYSLSDKCESLNALNCTKDTHYSTKGACQTAYDAKQAASQNPPASNYTGAQCNAKGGSCGSKLSTCTANGGASLGNLDCGTGVCCVPKPESGTQCKASGGSCYESSDCNTFGGTSKGTSDCATGICCNLNPDTTTSSSDTSSDKPVPSVCKVGGYCNTSGRSCGGQYESKDDKACGTGVQACCLKQEVADYGKCSPGNGAKGGTCSSSGTCNAGYSQVQDSACGQSEVCCVPKEQQTQTQNQVQSGSLTATSWKTVAKVFEYEEDALDPGNAVCRIESSCTAGDSKQIGAADCTCLARDYSIVLGCDQPVYRWQCKYPEGGTQDFAGSDIPESGRGISCDDRPGTECVYASECAPQATRSVFYCSNDQQLCCSTNIKVDDGSQTGESRNSSIASYDSVKNDLYETVKIINEKEGLQGVYWSEIVNNSDCRDGMHRAADGYLNTSNPVGNPDTIYIDGNPGYDIQGNTDDKFYAVCGGTVEQIGCGNFLPPKGTGCNTTYVRTNIDEFDFDMYIVTGHGDEISNIEIDDYVVAGTELGSLGCEGTVRETCDGNIHADVQMWLCPDYYKVQCDEYNVCVMDRNLCYLVDGTVLETSTTQAIVQEKIAANNFFEEDDEQIITLDIYNLQTFHLWGDSTNAPRSFEVLSPFGQRFILECIRNNRLCNGDPTSLFNSCMSSFYQTFPGGNEPTVEKRTEAQQSYYDTLKVNVCN